MLRWLETVRIPSISTESLTHQQLLRSMDALMEHQAEVDECVAGVLRPLIDADLSLVFYDLTTIRAEGLSEQVGDVRQFGLSKEGGIARQFMLGVVQTADGMPIYHEVFAGNTAESPTLAPTLKAVLARYPHVKRLIVVADRGLLSLENIDQLSALTMLRRRADVLVGKLDGQDEGRVWRGRKLSDSGAKACFYHEVCEAHLASIIRVVLKSDVFAWDIDPRALSRAQLMDGKLLLVTNVADLSALEIVQRYKALADIERGFRVLKSEIDIAPVYHRFPNRIQAHASLCFIALILYRVMRNRLRAAGHAQSPESVLESLRRIQHHTIST